MNVFDLFAKIVLDTSEYDKGLSNAASATSSFGSAVKGGLSTVANVGAKAISAATAATTAFAAASVKAGMSFDSSMSQVAATMGYSVYELNDETSEAAQNIAKLRDFAQEMGSKTAFSASEAADALNYMALAGYDAETSMDMLPTVLNLAAAGGIDLARASDMVTDASSALGLSLEETYYLVDEMAAASSKSNTSVAQLGDAILTVGGTAKNLAGGTTELNTALGILADNGIKGAEGGTALRNIILSLSAPTDKAADELERLGVSVYDEAGNMRELEAVFADLNGALSKMTQGEQTEALNTIFNKVDLKSANALLATSAERWEELSSAIYYSSDAAEVMAETQLDNLAGDITLFKSALEGAQIAISDGLTPNIREFVQFGASGISKLTDAFKKGGLSGAMGALGGVISDGVKMITKAIPQLVKGGLELVKALGKGILDNAPVLLDAAVQIISDLGTFLMENLGPMFDAAVEILLTLADFLVENLPELIPAIYDIIYTIVEKLTDPDMLMKLLDAAIEVMIALAEGLVNAIPIVVEKAPQIIANIVTALVKATPKLIDASIQMMVVLAAGIIDNLEKMISAGMEVVGSLVVGIVEWLANLVKAGAEMGESIREGFMEFVEAAKQWGIDLIKNFIAGIKQKWEDLKGTVADVAQSVKDFLGFSEPKEGPLSNFHTYAPDMMELFAQGIEDNKKMITDAIGDSFNLEPSIQASYAGSAAGAGSGDGGLVSALVQALRTVAPEFATNIRIDGNRDRIVDILVEENGKSVMAYGRGLLEA